MYPGNHGRTAGRAASHAALITLLVAPALAAQDPAPLGKPAEDTDTCPCAWDLEAPAHFRMLMAPERAHIGVMLGEPAEVGGRTGIRIEGVAPGSPAARAGLREGDILLSLNGEDLGDEPVEELLDGLENIDAGDTVTLGYSRDGIDQTATVVTERGGAFNYAFAGRGPGALRSGPDRVERVARLGQLRRAIAPDVRVRVRQVMRDGLNLVAMNEGLGEYFDVSEGVLVANVNDDTTLGLRAGDVIVSIGGRDVQDPAHARSIIASYRSDESIEFGIVRDGRRITVTGTRSPS